VPRNVLLCLSLAAMYLAYSFEMGAPPPTHVWTVFIPHAAAAQDLGVYL
jgi:hypothetical protein